MNYSFVNNHKCNNTYKVHDYTNRLYTILYYTLQYNIQYDLYRVWMLRSSVDVKEILTLTLKFILHTYCRIDTFERTRRDKCNKRDTITSMICTKCTVMHIHRNHIIAQVGRKRRSYAKELCWGEILSRREQIMLEKQTQERQMSRFVGASQRDHDERKWSAWSNRRKRRNFNCFF